MSNNLRILLLALAISRSAAADVTSGIEAFNDLQFDNAKDTLLRVALTDEEAEAASFYLGRIAMHEGKFEEAKKYFARSIELPPSRTEEYYWLGSVDGTLAQSASVFKASFLASSFRENMEKALELEPDNLKALGSLFQFYVVAPGIIGGSIAKAKKLLPRIESISAADANVARLMLLNYQTHQQEALELATAMVGDYPASASALMASGRTLSRHGQYDEALEAFELVAAMAPTPDNYLEVQGALFEIGQIAFKGALDRNRGMDALEQAIARFPVSGYTNWAYWRLAQLYKDQGDVEAQQEYLLLLQKSGRKLDNALKKEMDAESAE